MRASRLLVAESHSALKRGFIRRAPLQRYISFHPPRTRSAHIESRTYLRAQLRSGKLFDLREGQYQCLVEPVRLRLGCTCSKCVDPSDGQKNFSHAYIPEDITIRSHEKDDHGNYIVTWTNDVPGFDTNHVSIYTPSQIANSLKPSAQPGKTLLARPQQLWNRGSFDVDRATLSYDEYIDSPTGLALALHHLWQNGLVFIKDVPSEEGSVGKLAERIALLRNTFYGTTWDVRSKPDAENVAYTSRYLGFHMDLLYMKEPPGLQFLHCIENTCDGGESAFVDTFQALSEILDQGESDFQVLKSTQNDYGYNTGSYSYFDAKPVIFKGQYFHRRPKQTAEQIDLPPNHPLALVERVYWSPPFVKTNFLHTALTREEVQKQQRAQKLFADTLERQDLRVETKLPAGTCAIFDNLRIVHARNAFNTNSGHRWLRGAYLDYQDFFNKAQDLEPLMPPIQRLPGLRGLGR